MKDCPSFQEPIERYLAGEIPPSELVALHRHCRECTDCRQLIELHAGLMQDGQHIPEPRQADLQAMRRGVLNRISQSSAGSRSGETATTSTGRSFSSDLRDLLRAHPVAVAPLAVAILVAAMFLGRWTVAPSQFDDQMFVREIQREASLQQSSDGYADIPFSYSNVSIRPRTNGRLSLAFDVSRRIDLETTMDSPLAKDVLLHAILDQSATGSRMKAMRLTPEILDHRLAEALIFTLHNDPNLAVRLEALSVLNRYPYNLGIRDALLYTLQRDEAVQMRLLALDCLAGKQVDLETIRRTIAETAMAGDAAIMQHAVELKNEF